jgi:hypothetical protein
MHPSELEGFGLVGRDRLTLDEEELKTIEIIGRNGQSGRITACEIRILIAAYKQRDLLEEALAAADRFRGLSLKNDVHPSELADAFEIAAVRSRMAKNLDPLEG